MIIIHLLLCLSCNKRRFFIQPLFDTFITNIHESNMINKSNKVEKKKKRGAHIHEQEEEEEEVGRFSVDNST